MNDRCRQRSESGGGFRLSQQHANGDLSEPTRSANILRMGQQGARGIKRASRAMAHEQQRGAFKHWCLLVPSNLRQISVQDNHMGVSMTVHHDAFAKYVAILGRGPGRSRALTREEAREAFGMVL